MSDANGNLLSPSKIQWFNDIDDEHPIPAALLTSLRSSDPSPPQATIDHFFSSGNATPKAVEKPGLRPSCHSGRTTHPSARILSPDNTETPIVSSSLKQKAMTEQ